MLKSAKDEHSNAEKQRQIFTDFMRRIIKSVNSYVNKYITQDTENKQTDEAVVYFRFAQSGGSRRNSVYSAYIYSNGGDPCARKIAKPYYGQFHGVAPIFLKGIAHLTCEQVKLKIAHAKQSDRKEQRTDNLIFY